MTSNYTEEARREARVVLKIKGFLERELGFKLTPSKDYTQQDIVNKVQDMYTNDYKSDFVGYYLNCLSETIENIKERYNIQYKNGQEVLDEEDKDIQDMENFYKSILTLNTIRPAKNKNLFKEPKTNSSIQKVLYYGTLLTKGLPIMTRINNLILEYVEAEGAISEKTLNKLTEINDTLLDLFNKMKKYGAFANKIIEIIDEELMKDGSESK